MNTKALSKSIHTKVMCFNIYLFIFPQVMETERMIYLVTEYASGGEIFGKGPPQCHNGIFSQ